MGRKRVTGLAWLEPENEKQRLWALDYLRAKGFDSLFYFKDKILTTELPSHKEMLHAGMGIEREPDARELFRDMKDAWRQERDRNKKKNNGRQVCAFSLSTTTKANLQEMAKYQEVSATALLETLIEKAFRTHKSKLEKQPKTPRTASNYSFQGPSKATREFQAPGATTPPAPKVIAGSPTLHEQSQETVDALDTTREDTSENLLALRPPQTPEFPKEMEQEETHSQPFGAPPEDREPPVHQDHPESASVPESQISSDGDMSSIQDNSQKTATDIKHPKKKRYIQPAASMSKPGVAGQAPASLDSNDNGSSFKQYDQQPTMNIRLHRKKQYILAATAIPKSRDADQNRSASEAADEQPSEEDPQA